MDKEISPQSKRLKVFIDTTGMSLTEFGKQCKIPSTSSIHNVVALGKTPSTKLLDKIITRFPQLNHDWVLLGYGEMIVQGMKKQPANAISVTKSRDASYENIQQFLENHDYSLNELANKVQKAMFQAQKTYQKVNNRLDNFEDRLLMLEENQNNIASSVYTRLDGLWDKHKTKIDADIAGLVAFMTKLKQEMKETSDNNTQKAINFLINIKEGTDKKAEQVLGEFKKHTNPKHQE